MKKKWPEIKKKYDDTNALLGEIPKVAPSSKVVGDLAQIMVSQNLSLEVVFNRVKELMFP